MFRTAFNDLIFYIFLTFTVISYDFNADCWRVLCLSCEGGRSGDESECAKLALPWMKKHTTKWQSENP